jgi:hypothetical protein
VEMGLQKHNCEVPREYVNLPFFYGGADFDTFLACAFDGTGEGQEVGSRLDFKLHHG